MKNNYLFGCCSIIIILFIIIIIVYIYNTYNYNRVSTELGYDTYNSLSPNYLNNYVNDDYSRTHSRTNLRTHQIKPQDNDYNAEIVLYYASWCKFSRDALQEWDKFTKDASIEFPSLKVTQVQCDKNENHCKINNITQYPTIIFYINDDEIEYTDQVFKDDIINFVNRVYGG